MNKPVRTTIVFGLVSAGALFTLTRLLPLSFPTAVKLILWADLAVYAVLLCRWSRVGLSAILFPLAILLGAALWPRTSPGFAFLALGVFSWIRSGICFKGHFVRALAAELITVAGTAALIALWDPHSLTAWALSLWLFFLVQALYFFFIPVPSGLMAAEPSGDAFEQARQSMERLLENNP